MMRQLVTTLGLVLCLSAIQCNNPDSLAITDSSFTTPNQSTTTYKLFRRYFLLVPGDTALLYGTAVCTLMTNGVITRTTYDSIYYRTITMPEKFLSIDTSIRLVTPQIFQQSSAFSHLDDSSVLRYFTKTTSSVLQLGYVKDGKTSILANDKQLIIPNPLEIGYFGPLNSPNNNWAASPLLFAPQIGQTETGLFEARSTAVKTLSLTLNDPPYKVRNYAYSDGVEIRTYYSIALTGNATQKASHSIGSIVVTSRYFNDVGLVDQSEFHTLNTFYPDGSTEVFKKSLYFGRGPGGARKYIDFDTTSYH